MPRVTSKKSAIVAPAVAVDAVPSEAVSKSAPRKSPVPRTTKPKTAAAVQVEPAQKPAPSYEQIAQRAYELWQKGTPGSEMDHWLLAERELR